jgi:hypothetical protein
MIVTMDPGSKHQGSPHRALMRYAVEREADAQRAALASENAVSEAAFLEAADAYRRSWELAPPGSYGRLVGMLKAAILGGRGGEAARYTQRALDAAPSDSPTASYAAAIAALALGDDDQARSHSQAMRAGSAAFDRAASAIEALSRGDAGEYRAAVGAIVADFEARQAHLTGVAMADTASMLERLAAARGMPADVESALLPPPAERTSS